MEHALGPAVARREPVPLDRPLVEMLHIPPRIPILVKPHDPVHLVRRNPMWAHLAEPPVEQSVKPFRIKPAAPAPERPLRYPQPLRRVHGAQTAPMEPVVNLLKLHPPQSLKHLRPSHHHPSSERF